MITRFPVVGRWLLAGLGMLFLPHSAAAQVYRNVVNQRFNTVANGPMQALVVDVPNLGDSQGVMRAVASRINSVRRSRESAMMRELAFLKQRGIIKGNPSPGVADIVILRQNGRLALPQPRITRGNNDITLTFPAAGTAGSWTPDQQAELQTIWDKVYPELRNNVWGQPSWSGSVKLINGDNLTPIISDRNALSGGAFNATTNEILFAQYNAAQTKVLNLTQMMALAFRGPSSISYDVWERGMARAATLITVRNVLPLLEPAVYPAGTIDVSDPLWHAIDRYDLLNQPALGNDRFFPASKTADAVNTSSLAGMLVPRLQMSGSAWLKVAEENPGVFRQFNDTYYPALAGNPSLRNSVPALKAIVANIVPAVEGQPFNDWYQQQFVLDTSVTPGDKLYAWSFALRPNKASDDDYSIGIVLVYYRTSFDNNLNSDETNLAGTCFPVYWDFTYGFRLFLAAQYERVDIRDGLGTVAPTFFNTIGGDAALNGRMRVAIDLPVNANSVRLYTAPRDMGVTGDTNNFWGAVVGSDTGAVHVEVENGVTGDFAVKQGAFGGKLDGSAFTAPRRATLTFTDAQGQKTVRKVNLGYHEAIVVLYAGTQSQSITHLLPGGPSLISFPIRPFKGKAAEALLNPANDQPIFNEGNLLLAEWRQSVQTEDKYLKYPAMDALQPGHGYWSAFDAPVSVKINGKLFTTDNSYSTGLLHGWNQIGNPFLGAVDITKLQFQYLADNLSQDLAGAIAKGWILETDVPQLGKIAIWEYVQNVGYQRATMLQPWSGYWIRVLVSEGLTITWPNPAINRSVPQRRPTRAAAPSVNGWSVPLRLSGPNGLASTAFLGMSDSASSGFDPKRNALRPPDFSRAVPVVSFSHPELNSDAGEYLSEIHRTGSRDPWTVTVYTPEPNKNYTLSWNNLNGVPRSTRLILVDQANGRRQYLQSTSGYSFNSGTTPTRRFQILPEDRTRTTLRVMNVVARQSRAAGGSRVEIAYELSSGADVTAEIRGADGRVIRRLTAGRAAAAGVNQVLWDSRDDRAVSVPSGTYLVKITARTPEGDSASVVQPVLIVR